MTDLPIGTGTINLVEIRRALDREKEVFMAGWNARDHSLRDVEQMAKSVIAGNLTITFPTEGVGVAKMGRPTGAAVVVGEARFNSVGELIPPAFISAAEAEVRRQAGLTESVRKAVSAFRDQNSVFSVGDIHAWLELEKFQLPQIDPRGRIAMVMQTLRDQGVVEITQPGSGRTPHVYKAL